MPFGKYRKILMGYKGPSIHISLGLTDLNVSGSMKSLVFMSSRNVDRLKSIQRLHESMKMCASIFSSLPRSRIIHLACQRC